MSNIIEHQVVQMSFDNSKFNSKVDESMSSINKLKRALDFSDSSSKFEVFDGITQSFNALEIAAVTAVTNITNRLLDAGIKIAKSLSIDNVTAGWSSYSDMTTSVGTLVKQGNDLADVNEELAKLAWFTDETSYNFNSMVSTIGKFTASGQKLNEASTAIMGIANWAALSGQNAQTASSAMYQLSQAMSRGYMANEDYRSVLTGNMDNAQFRQNVLDTATALGKLTKVSSLDDLYSSVSKDFHGLDVATMRDLFSDETTMLEKAASLNIDVASNSVVKELTAMMETIKEAEDAFAKGEDLYSIVGETGKTFTRTNFTKYLTTEKWFDSKVMMDVFGKYASSIDSLYDITEEFDITASEAITAVRDSFVELEDGTKKVDIEKFARNLSAIDGVEIDLADEDQMKYLQDLIDALDEFGLEAFAAAQEARTFEDVINSVKDAVASQFRNIFTTIFGDYDEAVQLWTALSNELWYIFAGPLESIGELFSEWKDNGGRDALFSHDQDNLGAIFEIIGSIRDVMDIIEETFHSVFSEITSDKLVEMGKALQVGAKQFRESIANSETLRNVLTGIWTIVAALIKSIKWLWNVTEPFRKFIADLASDIFDIINAISLWIINQDKLEISNGIFSKTIPNIQNGIKKLGKVFRNFVENIENGSYKEKINSFGNSIKTLFTNINDGFKKITGMSFSDALKKIGAGLVKIIGGLIYIGEKLVDSVIENWPIIVKTFKKALSTLMPILGNIGTKTLQIIDKVLSIILNLFDSIANFSISDITKRDGIFNFLYWIRDTFRPLIEDFVASLRSVISIIPEAVALITSIFQLAKQLVDNVSRLVEKYKDNAVAKGILAIVATVALFYLAIGLLEEIIWEGHKNTVIGSFKQFLGTIEDVMYAYERQISAQTVKTFAESILMVASAFMLLSHVGITGVLIGISLMILLYAGLNQFIQSTKMMPPGASKILLSMSGLLLAFGATMFILASIFKKLTTVIALNSDKPLAILAAVGIFVAMAGVIGAFLAYSSKLQSENVTSLLGVAKAIKSLTSAVLLMTIGIIALSKVPIANLWSAVGAFAVIMTLLSGFITESKMIDEKAGSSLFKMASSLVILSGALGLLIPALLAFNLVSWESMGKAGAALVTMITLITVASIFAAKFNATGTILAIGGAILFIGSAMLASGAGLYLFGSSLDLIATNGAKAAPVILSFLTELINLIPLVFTAIAVGFGEMMSVLYDQAPQLANSFKITILSILEVVKSTSPQIINVIFSILTQIVQKTEETAPLIINAVASILLGIMHKIDETMPDLMKTAMSIIDTILTEIEKNIGRITDRLLNILVNILIAVKNNVGKLVDVLIDIVIEILTAVGNRVDDVLDAVVTFVSKILSGIIKVLPRIISDIIDFVVAIIDIAGTAITDGTLKIVDAMKNLISKLVDMIVNVIFSMNDFMSEIGWQLISGLFEGMLESVKKKAGKFAAIGNIVVDFFKKVFDIHSPSKVFAEIGEYNIQGLVEGMTDAVPGLSGVIEKIADLVTNGIDDDALTITPILDLSEIQNGTEDISSLLSSISGTSLTGDLATNISGTVNSATSAKNTTAAVPQTSTTNNSSTTNNTFNITGDNPKEIAEEVSKIINKQVGRRVAAWA